MTLPALERLFALMRHSLAASDVPSAVAPILEHLVGHTAAVGAAYFQEGLGVSAFQARSAWGLLPEGEAMQAILLHGLPAELPLLGALRSAPGALFFADTGLSPEAQGFAALGVCSLAAAPVRRADGALIGAFLMHTFEPHIWQGGEVLLFSAVAETLAALAGRLAALEEIEHTREAALHALGLAIEARDRDTHGHTRRVMQLSLHLAQAMGLPAEQQRALRWGAYLHDVGKIAISDSILLKPGKLDPQEWQAMQGHTLEGHRFAGALGFLPLEALTVILHHHERWDGAGYPHGLAREAIPRLARIFSVADVYDALVSERPYKRPWSAAEALGEIRAQSGRQFDPEVVAALEGVLLLPEQIPVELH